LEKRRAREIGDIQAHQSCSEANDAFHVVHRLNLFPLTHLNFFHMIFNLVAVTPLIERFESEYGTLVTLALFTGRKSITS